MTMVKCKCGEVNSTKVFTFCPVCGEDVPGPDKEPGLFDGKYKPEQSKADRNGTHTFL